MFEKIYAKAKEGKLMNDEQIKNEEDIIIEDKKYITIKEIPDVDKVCSNELYYLIKKYNFEILEYNKNTETADMYDHEIENYLLSNGKYTFVVKNMYDVDIPDGIFGIYEIKNIATSEKIKFYVDLSCRNTNEIVLDDFLMLINCNDKNEYIEKKYTQIYNLIDYVKDNHYNITDNTITCDIQKIAGFIEVDNKVYIIPYLDWTSNIRFVVSNNKTWGCNSYNEYDHIGYFINDFSELKDNIDNLKRHISGNYGYLENDIYYKNDDVEKFFDSFKRKNKQGNYNEAYNHHLIEIEHVDSWSNAHFINLTQGLELACHYKFILNDAAQWSRGDIVNLSDIVIKYDKSIDDKLCHLYINNYQYKCTDDIYDYYEEDEETIDELSTLFNRKYLVDQIILKGTFTECMRHLKEYTEKLMEIFDIKIE